MIGGISLQRKLLLFSRIQFKELGRQKRLFSYNFVDYIGLHHVKSKLLKKNFNSVINLPHLNFRNVVFYRYLSTGVDTQGCLSLLKMKPNEFSEFLHSKQIRRCLLWYDKETEKVQVSHDFLQEFADFLSNNKKFEKHEAIFFELGLRTNELLSAFIWSTIRGQAHGGIKLWNYNCMENLLKEGLKLSLSNGIKSVLADLWAGGGQGIIAEHPDRKHLNADFRQQLFFDYGDFLSGLNGCLIATEDVGLNVYDVNYVHSHSRYVSGISEDLGGLGNPAFVVAEGIICAMEATLDFLKAGSLEGKSVAVQGVGNVGSVIISLLLERGVASVYATDCAQKHIDDVRDLLAKKAKGRLEIVKIPFGDKSIVTRKCDILSPCAVGNIITNETLPLIQTKIVCGPAYNQISHDVDEKTLVESGIVFGIDLIVNRMGLVNQYVESQGRLINDPFIKQHFSKDWKNSIFVMTKHILEKSRGENITPVEAAKAVAEQMMEPNPLWPNRGQMIIRNIIRSGWHENKDFWRKRSNFPSARNVW